MNAKTRSTRPQIPPASSHAATLLEMSATRIKLAIDFVRATQQQAAATERAATALERIADALTRDPDDEFASLLGRLNVLGIALENTSEAIDRANQIALVVPEAAE